MNLRCSKNRDLAMTLLEVFVIISLLAVVAVMVLQSLAHAKIRSGPRCTGCLKMMATSCFVWAGDNNDKFPTQVSATNGGAMESANVGNAAGVFQVMSNELSTPKVLICPDDSDHSYATNWTSDFSAKHISYFVGVDAIQGDPRSVLSGDDNFQFAGHDINPGLRMMSTNVFYTWNTKRHHSVGNIAFCDGSVQSLTNHGLTNQLWETNFTVLRLAVP